MRLCPSHPLIARTFSILMLTLIAFSSGLYMVRSGQGHPETRSSRSRRIELVAFHPQVPGNSAGAVAAPEPIGPLAPVDPNAPPKQSRRSGVEAPKLVMPQETGKATVAKNLVGDKTCAECHPGEHALHFGSGHARTLRPAGKHPVSAKLADKLFHDEENLDVLWRYVVDGDRVEALLYKPGDPVQCVPLDWAVGSGEHGLTYMSIIYDANIGQYKGIEHRLSYLTDGHSGHHEMLVTPGQAKRDVAGSSVEMNETGRVLDRKSLVKCLECHSTITSDQNPGQFDPRTIVPNVSCERCHGPGREHVEAARKGLDESFLKMPLGPTNATPFRQIHECGTCHRRINTVPPSQLNSENFELARFQPVGIEASACYKEGKSGLKCTTCHDPHAKVSRDRSAYVAACVNCHQGRGQSLCKVEPKGDCISCHMPKRVVSESFRFTDHWIRLNK